MADLSSRAALPTRNDAGVQGAPDPAEAGEADESVKDALQQTLEEARMVMPGVQALFGFQLIAVFSDGFERHLGEAEQSLHLAAIVLVTIAIALVMTPAAYHRQVEPRRATDAFVVLASRLVSSAMLPLAAGLAIDVYLIARVITGMPALAATIASVVFGLFVALWFVFPQWRAAQARHWAGAESAGSLGFAAQRPVLRFGELPGVFARGKQPLAEAFRRAVAACVAGA